MAGQITIANREDLIFLLSEAAELEHGLLCSYLFAAFSLKSDPADGLAEHERKAVRGWKRLINGIAVEEMLHLTLVNNLLTAIGASPHTRRPNFPQRSTYYPPTFQLMLTPFDEATLEHFIYLERPEGVELDDPLQEVEPDAEKRATAVSEIAPEPQDYATVGQLYRAISDGIDRLVEQHGEARVFVGPERAQATPAYFQLPGLIAVTDRASARKAIDLIVEEGEGSSEAREDAHYGRFLRIRGEYTALRQQSPNFAPARPVLENPFARRPSDAVEVNLIDDPDTVHVADLCNGAYALMVQLLARFFAHHDETDDQLRALVDGSIMLMVAVIRPLGELLTKLPAGPSYPGRNAGPSFEFYRSLNMPPHRRAAWILFEERLLELAAFADDLTGPADTAAVAARAAKSLRDIAASLADDSPARTAS